jgi:cyclic-di-AMP phosphodiesterase PgpH
MLNHCSAKLPPMSARRKTPPALGETGMRRFFVLSLDNPILKYGAWLLFVLLVTRLSYVGFKGVIVPEVGEKATTYYVAPRSLSCDKPNPQYQALAEKMRSEVSPVYSQNFSLLLARADLLRTIESKLAVSIQALVQYRRQLREVERPRSDSRPIKESPYLKSSEEIPEAPRRENHGQLLAELSDKLRSAEADAQALISTIAPGLSSAQQASLIRAFRRKSELLQDAFRAASVAIGEVRRWYIVETLDLAFQRDRGQGIVLADSGNRLGEAERVYSYVEALDLVRTGLVVKVISENFPRIKGEKDIAAFVARIVVASVKPNLIRDERRTQAAFEKKLGEIQRTVPVEFAQGQTIVAWGDTVTRWQADCIGRFSAKTVGRSGLGDFMGIPIPTLLLLLGIVLLVVVGSIALQAFSTKVFHDRILRKSDYVAVAVLLVLHLALVRLFLFAAGVFSLSYPVINKGTMLTACPVGLAVMVMSAMLGARVAFLGMLFLMLSTSFVVIQSGPEMLSGTFAAYFPLYQVVVSLVGIWVTRKVTQRGVFFVAGSAYAGGGVLFWLIVLLVEGGQIPASHTMQLVVGSLVSGLLSYILLVSLTPMFEYLWDYSTDTRLLELSSTEHPALKELSRRAPGTYQHSLWIATLVEEAAEEIGANPLLSKVGAYYHDLGKLVAAAESGVPRGGLDSPLFFAENQAMGVNPHDHLSPHGSARILRKHVELSIKMIRKYRLGRAIEGIAAQHHGTSLMLHFYHKARLAGEEDGTAVDERDFRYPGPKPQTKEAALVMLGDSVEAATRSLPQHTEEAISERVRDLVTKRRTDGQLDECTLTFGDVKAIEESFIRTLVNMYHARPEYLSSRPEEKTVRLRRDQLEGTEEISTQEIKREGLVDSSSRKAHESDSSIDPSDSEGSE